MSTESLIWILIGVIYVCALVLSYKRKFNELAQTEVKVQNKRQAKKSPQMSVINYCKAH